MPHRPCAQPSTDRWEQVPALQLGLADTASRSRFEMEGQSSVSQPFSRSSSQPLSTPSNPSQPGASLTPDSQPPSSPRTSPLPSSVCLGQGCLQMLP